MAEVTMKHKERSWKRKLRGRTISKSPSKLLDIMSKSSKEKLKSQKLSIDEGLVDPSDYLDLFAMASQVISAKTDYFSEVKMMAEEEEIERRPPCNFSKEKESKCKLDDSTREDLYKLVMRVVNSATVLEDRLRDGKITTGADASASFASQEMHKQLQDMLQASNEEQKVWQARLATTAKYQKVLILTVHHADGLPSADQDGFSDPYCKMGLVPREKSTLGKQSLKSLPDPDQMEKSKIQRKTLDPVWEERFELLLVEQPRILVMEVWDDDMAQQSEGRNAIKGFRGLRFKIIDFFNPGQDDFLGKRCIDINTLPNEKTLHTLQLHGKNIKKKRGNIQITTEIIVRVQDSELETLKSDGYGVSLVCSLLRESTRHQYINDVDVNRDHRMKDIDNYIVGEVIQLLQVDEFSQAVARLGGSAQYMISLSYERESLKGYLEEVITNWDTRHTALRDDVMKGVVEDIESIYNHELCLLKQSRVLFPPNSNIAQNILKQVIQTIMTTFSFLKRIERVNTELDLKNEIEPNIKEDIHNWYQVLNANSQPFQMTTSEVNSTMTVKVTTLTNLCAEVAQDLITVYMLYQEAFEQMGISYFDIAYQSLDEILSLEITNILNSAAFTKYFEGIAAEDKKGTEENKREQFTFAILILKLYEYVKDIHQFNEHLNSDESKALKYKFEGYQVWFKPCVLSWMDVARNISIGTVKRAIEIDTREVTQDNRIKVTSSAIDITICFEQCYQFHRQLSWSHTEDGALIIAKIVKMICDIGKFYGSQMHRILKGDLEKKDKKPVLFELNDRLCVLVNNVQIVLEYMREIPMRLNWDELLEKSQDNNEVIEEWRKIVDNSINAIENDKSRMLQEIIVGFTRQFKIFFNEFMKKPQDEPIDDAIDVLMNWLANNLEAAWTTFMQGDFQLLLQQKWEEIVKICSELQKQKSKQISYCTRMAAAVDIFYKFLHVDGNGLKQEDLETEEYLLVQSALSLYGDNSEDLIAIYCSQLTETSKTVDMKYGSLTFSVYHLEAENVLKVRLIRGEHLPKMDTIGTCDPYIKFKTIPKSLFETFKTKHQSNTQNPHWKLDIELKMSENPSSIKGACLQMSLYDHDMFNKDDYGGSVYIAIDEIAKSNEEAMESTLNIMFPIQTQILSALHDRSDKEANKFTKKIKKHIDAESDLSCVEKEKGKKSKKKDKKKK